MNTSGRIGPRKLVRFGLLMCVLAALFAFEAKLAWYTPGTAPAAQLSSSKLQQTYAPRLIAKALQSSQTIPQFPAVLGILTFAMSLPLVTLGLHSDERVPTKLSRYFNSPRVFFRPPPAL